MAAAPTVSDQRRNPLVLVFSGFGRHVGQSAGNGPDHGTANNVLLPGGALPRKGIFSAALDLANPDRGDLRHRVDFRSIYATILPDRLGADEAATLGTGFGRMKLFS